MNTKLLIVSICIFVLTIFCGFDNYSDESQRNESIVKAFIESWNSHDINRLVSLFSENCLYEILADGGSLRGREQIARYAESTFSGVPDTKMITVKMMANDSIGVVEWIWKGTNSVGWPSMGIQATNKQFEVRGISIMEIENGLISKNSDYWNWNTFIKQVSN